jgi:hypothetical protein
MAEQNATSVAITGGTINGTTVGATTPAAGTFTTLTAQTEVLKGTGANLFNRSQTFSFWTGGGANITVTDNVTTAPDGTTTASSVLPTVTNGLHRTYSPIASSVSLGATYTLSLYAKANGYRYLFLNCGQAVGTAVFDVQAGAVTNGTATSSSITAVSGATGWYRLVITGNATVTGVPALYFQIQSSFALGDQSFAGDGTSSIYLWGAQLEFGSTANTYIPTTTTAVYGTPTLSFSGVSTIGLESNGSLFVQPAGTGALQAQATTSSATGGNARGANAVDWQTSRSTAAQVASQQFASILSGDNNTASAYSASVLGGRVNAASGIYSSIGGGYTNSVSGPYSGISNGSNNTAAGWYNYIGGGFTNSGTANGAVTTQSGTMNATTAVTLSGSNASIKVGQYITGTSIAGDTYVAAISGTSLTLSKVASGSSTSTLSFFTPHGVVVGGGNNQATGAYSVILGGGDAGTAANRNVASGDWSFVGGGINNRATAFGATIAGGGFDGGIAGNLASGAGSFIGGGLSNTSSGGGAVVGGGYNNIANATVSSVLGGYYATTRSIVGMQSSAACLVPIAYANGVSQFSSLILAVQTTDATATILRSNPNAAGTTNQVILPNNSAYAFKGSVIANVTGGGNTKAWAIEGAIKRGANAASTALVGTPTVTSAYADAGASTWAITATADTTNGGLAITFTGQASTTIRVVAKLETTEVTF